MGKARFYWMGEDRIVMAGNGTDRSGFIGQVRNGQVRNGEDRIGPDWFKGP
jgi:hypothetical protein